MKKIINILLLFASISSFSQFKITGYFDAKIGINYSFLDDFQAEIRINDDLGIDFSAALSLLYQFIKKENYNLNTGIGISYFLFSDSDLESMYIPLQIEILPFKNLRNLGLVLETAYHFSEIENGLRNSVGIRYIFN
ncbi:MAG: hypothetical protein ACJA17_000596 [Polaribacter sp.]|jgi:hypothetical protein